MGKVPELFIITANTHIEQDLGGGRKALHALLSAEGHAASSKC